MYHISRPSAKLNSALSEGLDDERQSMPLARAAACSLRLPSAARRRPRSARPGAWGSAVRAAHCRTQHQVARAARQAQIVQHPRRPAPSRARSARAAVGLHRRLGGAGEQLLLGRLLDGLALGASPTGPRPGSLAATSGTTWPSGSATKRISRLSGMTSPETMSAPRRAHPRPSSRSRCAAACHQASVFSSLSRLLQRLPSSTGLLSIQPILTRAFMMMALASSVVRSKPSSAPGTRTRSLSLLTS